MGTTGDLCQIPGEITMKWKIKDLFPLCAEKNKQLNSPLFYFSGASWKIGLYPNGKTEDVSGEWISLYIYRKSAGCPVTVDYSLKIHSFDENIYKEKSSKDTFYEKDNGWGFLKFMSRLEVEKMKSQPNASNDITVICNLKNSEKISVTGSLFSRHQKIIENLKELRAKAKKTDCTLKVNGQNIPAHRIILEKGSPVFSLMFTLDTEENRTGEVLIDDMEKNAVAFVIEYMYSGDIPALETKNMLSVYAAAEKYAIPEIKEMCLEFIKRNLSVDCVCDIIKFAELYNEEEIGFRAREYFKENARKILKTEKWKIFVKENHDLSVGLLSSVVEALLPE